MDEKISNYEKVFVKYKRLFLVIDHEDVARRLLLKIDDKHITIPYFGRTVKVFRETGDMFYEDGGEMDVEDKLLIMHHFYFSKPSAFLAGEMVPFREIHEAAHFEPAYEKETLLPSAEYFAGKPELFLQRAKELGGRIEKFGDASVTLSATPTIPLTYIFWDGDEEFPASMNILFDKNITQFIHAESVPAIAGAGAKLLMNLVKTNPTI